MSFHAYEIGPVPNRKRIRLQAGLLYSIAILAASFSSRAATSAKPNGTVEGHVLCDDGNVPARSATVRLISLAALMPKNDTARESTPEPVVTSADFSGYYAFSAVAPGTYIVDARKEGYSADLKLVEIVLTRLNSDQQRKLLAAFPQVTVNAGGILREDVVIHRAGAISGRVTVDTGGIPGPTRVTATLVSSDLIGDAAGNPIQKPVEYSLHAVTDDRGSYRIAGLPSGKYRLSLPINDDMPQMEVEKDGLVTMTPQRTGVSETSVFATEALKASNARLISVSDGEELTDVDVSIPTRLLHSISGFITQRGLPLQGAGLTIQSEGRNPDASEATSNEDGSYRLDLLQSGHYNITARFPDTAEPEANPAVKTTAVQLADKDLIDIDIELPSPPQPK